MAITTREVLLDFPVVPVKSEAFSLNISLLVNPQNGSYRIECTRFVERG